MERQSESQPAESPDFPPSLAPNDFSGNNFEVFGLLVKSFGSGCFQLSNNFTRDFGNRQRGCSSAMACKPHKLTAIKC